MEAAGRIRLSMEAKLSPGPPMLNLRRHGVNGNWHEKTNNVASGNFLGAKVSLHVLLPYIIPSWCICIMDHIKGFYGVKI